MPRRLTIPLLAATALLLTGCAAGAQESPPAETTAEASSEAATGSPSPAATESTRQEALAALPTKPETSEGFDPAAFGPELTAEDGEGCTTYEDALMEGLEDVVRMDIERFPCRAVSGTYTDPGNGFPMHYNHREDNGQHVDRLVSLEDAWASGADQWTDEQRRAFANDLQTLVVSSESTTAERAGADAAGWLPSENVCSFIDDQLQVKTTYELAVDEAERAALEGALAGCP